MKNYRAASCAESPSVTTPSSEAQEPEGVRADDGGGGPDGWQELPVAGRGARLFRLIARDGGAAQWRGEMTDQGNMIRRRFATELHARAWLAMWSRPYFTLSVLDVEELNGSLRASFLRGSD